MIKKINDFPDFQIVKDEERYIIIAQILLFYYSLRCREHSIRQNLQEVNFCVGGGGGWGVDLAVLTH